MLMHKCIMFAAAVLLLSSCGDGEKKERGLELLPDMFHTPAFKSQTGGVQQVVSADGKTTVEHQYPAMQEPVAGTVSRDVLPYQLADNDWPGARQLQNPLLATPAVLKDGQGRFNAICATCHGRDGNAANANVFKWFAGVPSLNGTSIPNLADGEIYHIITVGRGRMTHFRAQLPSDQRWSVVLYVRALNRAALALRDMDAEVAAIEKDVAANPNDDKNKSALATAKAVQAQRANDLQAVLTVSDDEAAAFTPARPALPEYLPPAFPSPLSSTDGAKP
jgi:mono/diheme cytochrome c family protein